MAKGKKEKQPDPIAEMLGFMSSRYAMVPEKQLARPNFNPHQENLCQRVADKWQKMNGSDPFAGKRLLHYLHKGLEDLDVWAKHVRVLG